MTGYDNGDDAPKPGWINVAVFILTACPFLSFLLATAILASWLFVSDFFLAREGRNWTNLEDRVAFLIPTCALFFLLAWNTRRRIGAKARLQFPCVELQMDDQLPIQSWCDMLSVRAEENHGIACRYFVWLRNRLLRLEGRVVSHREIGKAWREASVIGLKNLLGTVWIIVLLILLMVPQLYSPLMEQVSRLYSRRPSRPLSVFHRYYDRKLGYQDEFLEVDGHFGLWRPKTAFIGGTGQLFLKNSDFPRTNRQVCIAEFAEDGSSTRWCMPIHRGIAKYEFARMDRQPLLELDVTLEPYVGTSFYQVSIEHVRR